MKKIDRAKNIVVDLRRTFLLAKLGVTLLILSMFATHHSLTVAIAEKNIYNVILYSVLLIIQILIWTWNVFL